MTAEKLTAEKTIFWLKKTLQTINNMPQVRSFETNYRANDLADRYTQLKERAQELGVWNTYCENIAASKEHDGHDLFA
jgi:hypothetical protein